MTAALCAGLLIVATAVAYGPALEGGFVWDDAEQFVSSPVMTAPDALSRIWVRPETMQYYPLTFTCFWLQRQLWGLNPFGYHAVNVALHLLNAFLLGWILSRMRVPGSWIAAAVFALHPVHVESVAWVTELKNVLSGAFYLSAFACYQRSEREDGLPFYFAAIAFFLAALLSKTATLMLPATLVLVRWWQRKSWARPDVLRLAPFFLLSAVMAAVTILYERRMGAAGSEWSAGFFERLALAGRVVWFYLGKLLCPLRLTFIYPRWEIDPGAVISYAPVAAAAAAAVLLWRTRAPWRRSVMCGLGVFVVNLFPVLGFFDFYFMRYSYVADHFQYLPSLGLLPLAVGLAAASAGKLSGRTRASMAACLLLLLAPLTWKQAGTYRDLDTLWNDVLSKNPGAWIAHNNLGNLRASQGRLDEAVERIQRSIGLKPDQAASHNSLGAAYHRQGRMDLAMRSYRKALELDPDDRAAHRNLASALNDVGRRGEAIGHWLKSLRASAAVRAAPIDVPAPAVREHALSPRARELLDRADELARRQKFAESVSPLREASSVSPDSLRPRHSLGNALAKREEYPEALAHVRRAVELRPTDEQARYNLAVILEALGRREEAIEAFRLAGQLRERYNPAGAQFDAAMPFYDRGQYGPALRHFAAAIRHDPGRGEYHFYAGIAHVKVGDRSAAIRAFTEAAKSGSLREQANARLAGLMEDEGGGGRKALAAGLRRIREKRYDAAIPLLERAASLGGRQEKARAYRYLGEVYYRKKELGKTIEAWKRSVVNEPSSIDLWKNLALLHEPKDPAQALTYWRKYLALAEKDPAHRDTLVQIRRRVKDIERSLP
ncbi:MAG: tetratricopeptide repeat protein [Elusimicrobiota bacterium]